MLKGATVYFLSIWWITFFKHLFSLTWENGMYIAYENWLRKHEKGQKQPIFISIKSCTELRKTQLLYSLRVSLKSFVNFSIWKQTNITVTKVSCFNEVNLFLMEFMFRWLITMFLRFSNLNSLSFGNALLLCFFLAHKNCQEFLSLNL